VRYGNKIYVTGGQSASTSFGVYDIETNTWTELPGMLTPRYGHAMAVVGGKIYVFGGITPMVGALTSVEEFSFESYTWVDKEPMPVGTAYMDAVAYDGKVYIAGGMGTSFFDRFTTLRIYDPATNSWSTGASMSVGRSEIGAVVWQDQLWVVGGQSAVGMGIQSLATVEAYDFDNDSWTTMASLPTGIIAPEPVVLNDTLYVIDNKLRYESGAWSFTTGIPDLFMMDGIVIPSDYGFYYISSNLMSHVPNAQYLYVHYMP
jgi:hypothetical protein